MKRALAFLAALVICSATASAQYADFTLSAGYSNFMPQHSGGFNYSRDGAYIDADAAWRIPGPLPFTIGAGVGGAGTWTSQQNYFLVDNGNFVDQRRLYSEVDNAVIEPRISLPLHIPGVPNLLIRPRLGAGLLVDTYSIDVPQFLTNGNAFINTQNFTGAAFDIHPDLEIGYDYRGFSAGLDLAYLAAWGSFGGFGDNIQEFQAGLYVRIRL